MNMYLGGVSVLLFLAVVLEYGFSQVGFRLGTVPLPLTEVFLAGLVYLYILIRPFDAIRIPLPGWLLLFVVGLAFYRTLLALPDWGTLAFRDMTHFAEILTFFLGLWLFRCSSVRYLRLLCLVVFVAAIAYGSLYPFRFALQEISPKVTLVKTVPLVGSMSGVGHAVAAALFVVLLNTTHPVRYILGAISLGVLAYVQARGLYLAIPIAVLTAFLSGRRPDRFHILKGILISLVVALLPIKVMIPLAPTGRIGEISPQFFWEHLKTAFGAEGVASGSVEHRRRMIAYTIELVSETPGAWLTGLGMGIDLIGGSETGSDPTIRKPHDDYLEVYGRLGVTGLVPWVLAIVLVLSRLVGICRGVKDDEVRRLAISWLCVAVIYLFIAATQPLFSYPFGAVPFYSLLGMAWGLHEKYIIGSSSQRHAVPSDRPLWNFDLHPRALGNDG